MSARDALSLIEEIARLCEQEPAAPLRAFWYTCDGPRESLASEIKARRGSRPIVVYILKRPNEFCSANALSADVVSAISAIRSDLETALKDKRPTGADPLCIVLLSKDKLTIPTSTASPIALPEWIPGIGGRELPLLVENLDTLMESGLDCDEMQISQISSALWEVEHRIQDLLLTRVQVAKPQVERLLGRLCKEGKSVRELLEDCRRNLSEVTLPERFRPSCNDCDANLAGLLVREVSKRKLEDLPELGGLFSAALGLSPDMNTKHPRLLAGLLLRSRFPLQQSTLEQRLGEACLQTIYAASMLVTISHHADRMPRFPLTVIEGISLDIRKQLDALRTMLLQHS